MEATLPSTTGLITGITYCVLVVSAYLLLLLYLFDFQCLYLLVFVDFHHHTQTQCMQRDGSIR